VLLHCAFFMATNLGYELKTEQLITRRVGKKKFPPYFFHEELSRFKLVVQIYIERKITDLNVCHSQAQPLKAKPENRIKQ